MYSVTKRIDFCYGHRLLDYDGICKHPHGHNATAEIEVRTGTLDNRNMVCDFSDIKRIVKGWIDAELDHKMLLRHDDPLVAPLKQLGEPVYLLDSNPTVERIAKLIFDKAHEHGLPVDARHRLGNADLVCRVPRLAASALSPQPPSARVSSPVSLSSFVFDLDGTLVDSRRDIADAANALLVSCGAAPIAEEQIGAMVGDGAATLVARAFKASGIERPPDALERYLALYDARLLNHTRPYDGIPEVLEALGRRAALAVLTNKPIASTRRILDGLDLARHFPRGRRARRRRAVCRASRIRRRCCISSRARRATPASTLHGRRFRHRLADGARGRRRACVSRDTGSVSTACRFTNWHRRIDVIAAPAELLAL